MVWISAAVAALLFVIPATADAQVAVPVDACNAPAGDNSNLAWTDFGNGMGSFGGCPMQTWSGPGSHGQGAASRLAFFAPSGTTIESILWGGSWGKSADCGWSAEMRAANLSTGWSSRLMGVGAGQGCGSGGGTGDGASWYVAPGGTTALYQQVECGYGSCVGGGWSWFLTRYARVVLIDHQNPAVYAGNTELGSGRWVRGRRALAYYAEDNLGISRVEMDVDGVRLDADDHACDFRRAVACSNHPGGLETDTDRFPDGPHQVRITAYDPAGRAASTQVTSRFDNHAPERVPVTVEGGEGWRRRNGFDVTWSNPPEAHAPIAGAGYRLCRVGTSTCETGRQDGSGIHQLLNLPVPESGDYTLEVWRIDEAGNGSDEGAKPSPPVRLRFDPNPPQLAFEPQDPADPLKVSVAVSDDASGPERGTIEMKRVGAKTWHEVDAHLEDGHLVGYVDDQQFGDGNYELRAHAIDYAGNTGSTDRQANGAGAGLRLPVRVPTFLRVGVRKARLVKRGRGKRTGRRRVFKLVPRARVGIGRSVTLHGRLTNPDGHPIDGATIEVFGKSAFGEGGFGALGLVRTDAKGRFTYRARGSESRVLRFHYRGGRRIRAATRDVFLRVPAYSSLSVSDTSVFNGDSVTFRGRLRGGHTPDGGKLLEMQAFFRNRWRTFSTVRSDARGRWRFGYQFGGTSGRITYRFRLVIPHEGGYPFDTGLSRVLRVAVRGP